MLLGLWLVILGIVLLVMGYFLPDKPPMNDILEVAGVIACIAGLIWLAVGGILVVT